MGAGGFRLRLGDCFRGRFRPGRGRLGFSGRWRRRFDLHGRGLSFRFGRLRGRLRGGIGHGFRRFTFGNGGVILLRRLCGRLLGHRRRGRDLGGVELADHRPQPQARQADNQQQDNGNPNRESFGAKRLSLQPTYSDVSQLQHIPLFQRHDALDRLTVQRSFRL